MTIPFGRRRLILTLSLTTTPHLTKDEGVPLGLDDRELVRWTRTEPLDIDRARWEGLSLIYGGVRRP